MVSRGGVLISGLTSVLLSLNLSSTLGSVPFSVVGWHWAIGVGHFDTQSKKMYLHLVFPMVYSVADPDPGSVAFLTPESWMGEVRIRIRVEQPGSYFLELRNHFFGLKYSNSLMQIRDPGRKKFGSGMKKRF